MNTTHHWNWTHLGSWTIKELKDHLRICPSGTCATDVRAELIRREQLPTDEEVIAGLQAIAVDLS